MDELGGFLPLAGSQGFRRLHDMIAGVLRRAREDLTLMVLKHTPVGLADNSLLHVRRRPSLSEQRNLKKHAAGEVNTLQQLKINMHVERQLSLLLESLLLGGNLAVPLDNHTLSEQLLLPTTAADLLEGILSIINESLSESAESDLDQRPVVENLARDIEAGDTLLQMRHKHHVSSLVVLIMQSQEVNLAEHGSSTNDTVAVDKEIGRECIDQKGWVGRVYARRDAGVDASRREPPAVLLQNLDNLSRLIGNKLVNQTANHDLD